MDELFAITRHVDGHGFGSAIIGDHVAIGVIWTTRTPDGGERKREIIERAHSHEEACRIMGCGCRTGAEAA